MDALTPDTYNAAESLIGPHPYDGLDAEAAARLLQRLLKRGIICGDARTLGWRKQDFHLASWKSRR